jgi:hypothetical protein
LNVFEFGFHLSFPWELNPKKALTLECWEKTKPKEKKNMMEEGPTIAKGGPYSLFSFLFHLLSLSLTSPSLGGCAIQKLHQTIQMVGGIGVCIGNHNKHYNTTTHVRLQAFSKCIGASIKQVVGKFFFFIVSLFSIITMVTINQCSMWTMIVINIDMVTHDMVFIVAFLILLENLQ